MTRGKRNWKTVTRPGGRHGQSWDFDARCTVSCATAASGELDLDKENDARVSSTIPRMQVRVGLPVCTRGSFVLCLETKAQRTIDRVIGENLKRMGNGRNYHGTFLFYGPIFAYKTYGCLQNRCMLTLEEKISSRSWGAIIGNVRK